MVKLGSRRTYARAIFALVLSYLLVLNAFVLTAAPAQAEGLGVICGQNRSTPNQPDHHKTHPCCTFACHGAGSLLAGPPVDATVLPARIAEASDRRGVLPQDVVWTLKPSSLRARGPPTPL